MYYISAPDEQPSQIFNSYLKSKSNYLITAKPNDKEDIIPLQRKQNM